MALSYSASITLPQFRRLLRRAQLLYTLLVGTYLAQRWEGALVRKLYYLPDGGRGFFAEIGVDEARECFVVLRSFSSSGPLEAYTHCVQLPA
ncbi:MAG: hypothetical protein EOO62_23575 [Hymenobacter sp.]|nr:MAG: hypothetical protein EOO62_23575 [Hymenobacter sp.]